MTADQDAQGSIEARLKEELAPELELVRPLGRGSVATVYLARESELKRWVAVKVLLPEMARDERTRRRFLREARSAASISHPNVVTVHRVGTIDGDIPYQVMKYVKGRTLADRIKAEGRFGVDEARSILRDVASALAAAHRNGIVHRDVKPANILCERDTDRVYLADFAIAGVLEEEEEGGRLTQTGEILGDPTYISPEQLQGEEITDFTDVYSLGIVGYELLTGRPAFGESNSFEMAIAHLREEPPQLSRQRPEVDSDLEDLLMRCLAKTPAHRPRAEDLVQRLEHPAGRSSARPTERRAERDTPGDRRAGSPSAFEELTSGGFFGELKERRVPQIVGGFLALGYGSLELIGMFVENDVLPRLAFTLCLTFVAAGIPASLVISWFHGKKGEQRVRPAEVWILGAIVFGWLVASAVVVAGGAA